MPIELIFFLWYISDFSAFLPCDIKRTNGDVEWNEWIPVCVHDAISIEKRRKCELWEESSRWNHWNYASSALRWWKLQKHFKRKYLLSTFNCFFSSPFPILKTKISKWCDLFKECFRVSNQKALQIMAYEIEKNSWSGCLLVVYQNYSPLRLVNWIFLWI